MNGHDLSISIDNMNITIDSLCHTCVGGFETCKNRQKKWHVFETLHDRTMVRGQNVFSSLMKMAAILKFIHS